MLPCTGMNKEQVGNLNS